MSGDIVQWVCSQRCWSEGGPHDELCKPLTNNAGLEEPTPQTGTDIRPKSCRMKMPRCRHGHIILGCPDDKCPEQNVFLAQQKEAADAYFEWRIRDTLHCLELGGRDSSSTEGSVSYTHLTLPTICSV